MKKELMEALERAAISSGIQSPQIKLDYPELAEHGDFTTNVAFIHAKQLKMSPKVLAEKIIAELIKNKPDFIQKMEVAGPGFINFFVKGSEIAKAAISRNTKFPKTGEEVMIEYTDPNTFKVFHIGHLMSNAIGESLSRLFEFTGTKVVRVCYPSDIGLHIAKAVWAILKHESELPADSATIQAKTDFLGKMYVEGTRAYEENESAKKEIDALNVSIYDGKDKKVSEIYKKGRQWSLDHFDLLYKLLGTKFDDFIFESEMAPLGLKIVRENLKKGVFSESDGAIIFKGEDHGLHTRVFVSSKGIPTYEAKDVGLNVTKFSKYRDADKSIIITGSEQNDYFKVLLKVLELIDPKNGPRTMHIGHGMMRFADGKMSSRTGNVVTAESLLADIKGMVKEKIADRDFGAKESEEIADTIAVGAIKYSILRQAIGGDIIFNSSASISFEGDSGPYLQYSVVRAKSVLEKAGSNEITDSKDPNSKKSEILNHKSKSRPILPDSVGLLERLLIRFSDVVSIAREEYAPQYVANYLVALAGAFNSFYASQTIIDETNKLSPYYLALTEAFSKTMTDGLWLLGIKVPERM